MMLPMALLPWPEGGEDWRMGDVSTNIVHPLVVREGTMSAVVADDKEGTGTDSEHPTPEMEQSTDCYSLMTHM